MRIYVDRKRVEGASMFNFRDYKITAVAVIPPMCPIPVIVWKRNCAEQGEYEFHTVAAAIEWIIEQTT